MTLHARTACPVCDARAFSIVYDVPYAHPDVTGFIDTHYRSQGTVDFARFADASFVVAHCGTCDLLFQVNVPADDLLDHIYNEMIDPAKLAAVERDLITLDSVDKIVGEMATLFRLTGKAPSDITMLDYGMGYGRFARVARGMGATVYATEIGEEKRAIAASLGVQVIADEAIDTMRFDIVHTEQVLEHLTFPGRDFARLARATGILFKAAVPARGKARELLATSGLPAMSPYHRGLEGGQPLPSDDAVVSIQPLEHLNAYSPTTMDWLAAHNELELISRVRMGTVGLDISAPARFARTAVKSAKMLAKAIMRPDKGYYLFRKR
jgi:hypothetical protein